MASLSPLASASATRGVLEAHGLATKHALGQNFLISDGILRKIVALADVGPDDVVLEVGPGIGTLTIALLKCARAVVSVERDSDLAPVLADTCAPWADRFALIQKDALSLVAEDLPPRPLPEKLVANLPYAVAATIVLDYFERFTFLETATIMVQKEVADRMAATPGSKDYGAFTVKLSLYAEPKERFAVGPQNFFPPPRVDSAVLRLDRRALLDDAGQAVDVATTRATSMMADAAFANRRKTIANSCKTYFKGRGIAGAEVAAALPEFFEQANIDPSRRGETLTRAEFLRLGSALRHFQG